MSKEIEKLEEKRILKRILKRKSNNAKLENYASNKTKTFLNKGKDTMRWMESYKKRV